MVKKFNGATGIFSSAEPHGGGDRGGSDQHRQFDLEIARPVHAITLVAAPPFPTSPDPVEPPAANGSKARGNRSTGAIARLRCVSALARRRGGPILAR